MCLFYMVIETFEIYNKSQCIQFSLYLDTVNPVLSTVIEFLFFK